MTENEILGLLEALEAAADTRFENIEGDYRALIVLNPTDTPYTGVAILRVDMPLKSGSEPCSAAVWTPEGERVPCQILNSLLEPIAECHLRDGTVRPLPEGSRRWRFDLVFWVENVPPRGYRVYRSAWAVSELPLPQLPDSEPPVYVQEAIPHAGTLPKEGSIPF
ncbi:MAG: hypothetical protein N2651_02990 [Fimbriimonadales bacterium]|nr:hypothetical protein [Fimbriimonadales bacterium]